MDADRTRPDVTHNTDVIRSIDIPVDAAELWRALTDGAELSAWFAQEVEIDAHPGGQVVVRDGGRRRRAVIVHFEPDRQLGLRWLPDRHPVGFVWPPDDGPAGEGGEITFTLVPIQGGTRLTVVETPPAPNVAARDAVPISLPVGYVVALGGRCVQVGA